MFEWVVSVNETTGEIANASASFILNAFRTDTHPNAHYDTAEVKGIGEIVSDNISYPIIQRGPDGLYDADWTDSVNNTFNMAVVLPVDGAMRTDVAILNVTLNRLALLNMPVDYWAGFNIEFGDMVWYVNVERVPS